MNLRELADKSSAAVRAALKRGCPVCQTHSPDVCRRVGSEQPLVEVSGLWVHSIRADGLPYKKEEGIEWRR